MVRLDRHGDVASLTYTLGTVWVGLSSMGLGASLQHFNPVIDETIYDTWKIDRSWKLVAQMPFGAAIDLPPAKPKLSLEERRFVYGQRQ